MTPRPPDRPAAVRLPGRAARAAAAAGRRTTTRQARGGAVRNVDPQPDESIKDVIDRMKGASTASGCEAVKGLLHSTYGDISDAACQAVKAQIDGFQDPRGAAYKTGAAISYRTATGRRRLIALALDADRTYRIAFIEDAPGQPIGTSRPAAFDQAARAVVRAMRDGDCDAFLPLVSRTDGLGVGPDEEVCRRVSDAPFRRELVGNRARTAGGARRQLRGRLLQAADSPGRLLHDGHGARRRALRRPPALRARHRAAGGLSPSERFSASTCAAAARTRARKARSRRARASRLCETGRNEPSPVMRMRSAPASSARCDAVSTELRLVTASASIESVMTAPR